MNDSARTGPYQSEASTVETAQARQPESIGRYRVEKVLGKGGFGLVYLAHDPQLQRRVAIKVPHRHQVATSADAEAYLTEARTVANLDHPHIVPVYDVGSTDQFPYYAVSKYIEGVTLAQRINSERLSVEEATELVATVAETLHYAHRQGLIHRDIKPSNILLDTRGKPFVADFGLALREQDMGKGPRYAGTPAYMSPEQARSEGHRVDGRSDIFSLGVVFYELLAGRRPFRAESQAEIIEQITACEARPLRQTDESIPRELERICFKALSKRAAERYMTAQDMADDLRHFQAEQTIRQSASSAKRSIANSAVAPASPSLGAKGQPGDTSATTPSSGHQPLKIVPKGLRSFDAADADFFLELLPGPRDREGLPDSIRFWKTRIEEQDPESTFSVGLIYGPSGCGKTSLVKAGLLPVLSKDVICVYVEATSEETETRLISSLRKRGLALSGNLSLQETLANLRRGHGIPVGKKVLIFLDQFEQWLHANKEAENTELVRALRQCDGGRVQCIIMVRDDFWMAVTRFMRLLETDLVPGRNTAAADLFDLRHTRKVLTAFGRAFGALPENAGDQTGEQKTFVEQAVQGLAQDGKVICVRLALFAHMMKGKSWTPGILQKVGGTEGVGVSFLDDSFSAPTANPKHRLHQKAARAVLRALLPESGTDLKGHMRSYGELLEVSGYVSRPRDFDELIRILDTEIRLVTPTDPAGKDDIGGEPASLAAPNSDARYYQLTHDYLVRSLREWLTRKQKETRRGRAELLLEDRASVWNARRETRQLPSLAQWLGIRLWTRKKSWTETQRNMMRSGARRHASWLLMCAVFLALIGWGSYEGYGNLKAYALRDRLLDANTADVPTMVKDMAPYRRWIEPLLRDAYKEAAAHGDSRKQLHASLALLPVDAEQHLFLYQRLLDAAPQEAPVLCNALARHRAELLDKLWAVVARPAPGLEQQRLRAACALALMAPDSPHWAEVRDEVVGDLVAVPAVYLALWMDGLRPVRGQLQDPLMAAYRDGRRRETERSLATSILADYVADQPAVVSPTTAYDRLKRFLDQLGA